MSTPTISSTLLALYCETHADGVPVTLVLCVDSVRTCNIMQSG